VAAVWRHIAQSLQGPSHLADGTPCQDNHLVEIVGEDARRALVACVADGAGSAKHSDVGSSTACQTVVKHAARFLEAHDLSELQQEDVMLWCDDVRSQLKERATEQDCNLREFATTLCGAIVGAELSVFFQIGDGAIILGNESLYGIVFWPQSGEYANTTNFLTADEYHAQLEFIATTTRFSKVALMTDGIERLALQFDTQVPHVPFFDPLFRALRKTDDVTGLNEGLRGFLSSDSFHNRTDDDKTLVLATRCVDGAA
jgi:hypothetical protein